MPVERLVSERLLRRVERLSLRVRSMGRSGATGEHRGRGYSSSLELSDHRAYTPGDDFRRIDWNALARLGTLNLKQAEPQQNVMLHLLVDRSASMEFGSPSKARMAQQIAACLAYLGLTQLDGVRVYGLSGARLTTSPRFWGKGQAADALRYVEGLETGRDTDLESALGAFLGGHPERGLVLLLTDLLAPTGYASRLRQVVAARFEVGVVHILSTIDVEPQLTGNLEIVDSETGHRRRIGLTPQALADYREGVARWRSKIAVDFRQIGVRYMPLLSHQPIEAVMLADLRRFGLLE